MSPADLATTSDTLAWLAVLSYVVAATLFGLDFAYRLRWLGVAGLTVTVAGLAANVGAAVTRGLAVGRVPDLGGPTARDPPPRRVRAPPGSPRHGPRRPGVPGAGRPAGPGPQLPLDRDPRRRGHHRLLGPLPRRRVQHPVPGQGAVRAPPAPPGAAPGRRGGPDRRPGRGRPGGGPPRDHLGPDAVGRHPRPPGLPDDRLRLPHLDLRHHRRGHLGPGRLGPLLGLGPQGDLVVHLLDGVRRLPARQSHRRLARPPRRLAGDHRPGHPAVQLLRGQHGHRRPPLLRRPVGRPRPSRRRRAVRPWVAGWWRSPGSTAGARPTRRWARPWRAPEPGDEDRKSVV